MTKECWSNHCWQESSQKCKKTKKPRQHSLRSTIWCAPCQTSDDEEHQPTHFVPSLLQCLQMGAFQHGKITPQTRSSMCSSRGSFQSPCSIDCYLKPTRTASWSFQMVQLLCSKMLASSGWVLGSPTEWNWWKTRRSLKWHSAPGTVILEKEPFIMNFHLVNMTSI